MKLALRFSAFAIAILSLVATSTTVLRAQTGFHSAPASAKSLSNPDEGGPKAVAAGKPLHHLRCARCHGERGEGSGNIPSIAHGKAQAASSGELFWFITNGDVENGMPAWATLPKQQRWHIISYVKSLGSAKAAPATAAPAPEPAASNAPPPNPPFTDYRFEKPGAVRRITPADLPAPFATASAGNSSKVVARPEGVLPQVLPAFKSICTPPDSTSPA